MTELQKVVLRFCDEYEKCYEELKAAYKDPSKTSDHTAMMATHLAGFAKAYAEIFREKLEQEQKNTKSPSA